MSVLFPDGRRAVGKVEKEPTFGISQRELAAMCNLSRAAIRHVEKRAVRKFREAVLREAAVAGVTPIEWLFGFEKSEETNG